MEDEKISDTALKSYLLSRCRTNMGETINQACCKNSVPVKHSTQSTTGKRTGLKRHRRGEIGKMKTYSNREFWTLPVLHLSESPILVAAQLLTHSEGTRLSLHKRFSLNILRNCLVCGSCAKCPSLLAAP